MVIRTQDITELRSESKMLANYVRICGAAVWSLKGNAKTGVVTEPGTWKMRGKVFLEKREVFGHGNGGELFWAF